MQTSERSESERESEIESERERDNKSMLNPSLSNFRNFERHKSSLTAVSTHKLSSGSWTRRVRNRRPRLHGTIVGFRISDFTRTRREIYYALERATRARFWSFTNVRTRSSPNGASSTSYGSTLHIRMFQRFRF